MAKKQDSTSVITKHNKSVVFNKDGDKYTINSFDADKDIPVSHPFLSRVTNPETASETVTVEQAKALLHYFNNDNRDIDRDKVDRFVAIMKDGAWVSSNKLCPIGFFKDGNIATGQHRLIAQVLANTDVQYFIVPNVSADERAAADSANSESKVDKLLNTLCLDNMNQANIAGKVELALNLFGYGEEGFNAKPFGSMLRPKKAAKDSTDWSLVKTVIVPAIKEASSKCGKVSGLNFMSMAHCISLASGLVKGDKTGIVEKVVEILSSGEYEPFRKELSVIQTIVVPTDKDGKVSPVKTANKRAEAYKATVVRCLDLIADESELEFESVRTFEGSDLGIAKEKASYADKDTAEEINTLFAEEGIKAEANKNGGFKLYLNGKLERSLRYNKEEQSLYWQTPHGTVDFKMD